MRAWRLTRPLACLETVASAAEVGSIRLEERTSVGAAELVLNGAGLRERVFSRVCVAGLYLTAREVVDALENGSRDNSSPAEQLAVNGRVERLVANLLEVRQGRKGDVLTVDWHPGAGTQCGPERQREGRRDPRRGLLPRA